MLLFEILLHRFYHIYLRARVHIFWVFWHILSFSHGIKIEKEWNACLLLISSTEKNSFRRFIYLNYLCLFYFMLVISVWRKIYIISENWMFSFLHLIFWVFFIIMIIIRHDILLCHLILGGNNILYMLKRVRAHTVEPFVICPSRV